MPGDKRVIVSNLHRRAVRSGQLDGAGIVLSLESKNLEVLEAARELLLASLPESVTVMSQEADSRRHSKRASTEWQRKVV